MHDRTAISDTGLDTAAVALKAVQGQPHWRMAVQHPNSVLDYAGNNSTVLSYPVSFRFLLESEVKVSVKFPDQLEPVLLTQGDDYTITPEYDANNQIIGGDVLTVLAYDNTHRIFIFREVSLTQLTELPEFGPFPANALEMSLDKAVMALQQQDRAIKRCFRVTDYSDELTPPYPQPNTVLGISADNDLRLFNGADLLSLIQLPGSLVNAPTAYWLNDFDRALKVPDFVGQLGLQMDEHSLYHSTGTAAGDWSALMLDEDDMSSDNDRMPPSQQSVKVFVEASATAATNAAITDANDYTDTIAASIRTPSGVLAPYAGVTSPSGWLLCHGQAVSRVTYADLFTAISTTYGNGDGSTTFNLPDLRGRTIAGKDDMGGSAANRLTNTGDGNPGINGSTLGAAGGNDRHQLTVAQMPSHNHSAYGAGGMYGGGPYPARDPLGVTGSTGGDQAHPNVQPTMVLNYIIKI